MIQDKGGYQHHIVMENISYVKEVLYITFGNALSSHHSFIVKV